jgi:glycerol-3-phosphate dehydrogenase
MDRKAMLKKGVETPLFDIIIIGGGASGLGSAVDAASRGLKVLLVEQFDFGKGTSSKSTKLIHGGLRYLQQGNVKLVREALKERGLLTKNAPHLVSERRFLIPVYHWYEFPFYGAGLKIYDFLSCSYSLRATTFLSKKETIEVAPQIRQNGLKGGLVYSDGQFDDARLLISLAHTATDLKAVCLNYMKVKELIKEEGIVKGVVVEDFFTKKTFRFRSKVVLNATGVFADAVRHQDNPEAHSMMAPSQGIHLVLSRKFLSLDTAILIPRTADGRVLFVVPWLDKVLLGTTDTFKDKIELEPKYQEEEIEFLLSEAAKYLEIPPTRKDILSIYAGLRPLIRDKNKPTKAISREHLIEISTGGLITLVGGKWTTFRKMGEDAIEACGKFLKAKWKRSRTEKLKLHGYMDVVDRDDPLLPYGSDKEIIQKIAKEKSSYAKKIHPKLPYIMAEVIFALRHEMAFRLEDVFCRRTRALFLDSKSTLEAAPEVAKVLAAELGFDEDWIQKELEAFHEVAKNFTP